MHTNNFGASQFLFYFSHLRFNANTMRFSSYVRFFFRFARSLTRTHVRYLFIGLAPSELPIRNGVSRSLSSFSPPPTLCPPLSVSCYRLPPSICHPFNTAHTFLPSSFSLSLCVNRRVQNLFVSRLGISCRRLLAYLNILCKFTVNIPGVVTATTTTAVTVAAQFCRCVSPTDYTSVLPLANVNDTIK